MKDDLPTISEGLPVGFELLGTLITGGEISDIAWSPDGRIVASSYYGDRKIGIWDPLEGKLISNIRSGDRVRPSKWPPDRQTLATREGGWISLWDIRTGKLVGRVTRDDGIDHFAWSPDGQKVLNTPTRGRSRGDISIRDAESGMLLQSLAAAPNTTLISWSPDSRIIASCGYEAVQLWDAESGVLLRTLRDRQLSFKSWSPDSRTIATVSNDSAIRLWNAESGKQTNILEGHLDQVLCVSFSPDGQVLASGSKDGTIRLWNCETWEPIAILLEDSQASNPRWSTRTNIDFHPDSTTLATIGARALAIHIWRLDYPALFRGRDALPATKKLSQNSSRHCRRYQRSAHANWSRPRKLDAFLS